MKKPKQMRCSICKDWIGIEPSGWAEGHNAQPVNDGRCCEFCNSTVVIPARLERIAKYEKARS